MSISYYKNRLMTNLADATKINYKAYYHNYILFGADATPDTGDTPYTYLEWIQPDLSTTNPFFDTNYIPSVTTTVEVKMGPYENENCWLFGGYVTGKNIGIAFGSPNLQNGMTMYSVAGSRFYDTSTTNWGATNTWVFTPTSTSHNGNVIKTYSQCTTAYTQTIKVFAAPFLTNNSCFSKFYYMKSYDNGVLTHNIVPVIRNSDGQIGLYDTVEDTFITPYNSNAKFNIPTEKETYAKFTGGTYFNLGTIGNRDYKITMDIAQVNTASSQIMSPFGVVNSNNYAFSLDYLNTNKKWRYDFGSTSNWQTGSTTVNSADTYHIVFNVSGSSSNRRCNYVMTDNGNVSDKLTTTRSYSNNTNLFSTPLYFGGCNYRSAINNYFVGLIKDVKVFANAAILYDYEFVERNGVVVMHEKINNTYLSPTQGSIELVSV